MDTTRRAGRWPNFFLVGAAKAGTTSLHRLLGRHPRIFMSPMKEPHFFSRVQPAPTRRAFFPVVADEAAYLQLFRAARGDQLRGEASTSYLWDRYAAGRIAAVVPDARIVVILRDPVERAYSDYLNGVREGIEHRSFEDALREELGSGNRRWGVDSLYIDCGRYAEQLSRYLSLFPGRVTVLFFEHLVAQPATELERLWSGLGVEPPEPTTLLTRENPYAAPTGRLATQVVGSAVVRRAAKLAPPLVRRRVKQIFVKAGERPPMPEAARALLREVLAEETARLARLLDRPLPMWQTREPAASNARTRMRC